MLRRLLFRIALRSELAAMMVAARLSPIVVLGGAKR